MVQVSWWLFQTREPENLPVTQFHMHNMAPKDQRVLGGCLGNPNNFGLMWVEKCFSNWRDELVSESKVKQKKANFFFLSIFRVCVLTSKNMIKKNLQRTTQWFVFLLIPDTVRLTTEISHHTTYKHAKIDWNKWVQKHIKTISINQDPKYQTH